MGWAGSVDIRIYNINGGYCEILDLDGKFNTGNTDSFYGDNLATCLLFYIPDSTVSKITVQHWGSDAWKPEWFRMFTDLGKVIECKADGNWIDGSESRKLTECHVL
jgi:hypothetical protein